MWTIRRRLCAYTRKCWALPRRQISEQGPFRWLTVASPEDPDGTELQLAQGQPAAMFYSDDVKGDYKRIKARGAEFTLAPTEVPGATIAKLNDTCGNLIQITQLARW